MSGTAVAVILALAVGLATAVAVVWPLLAREDPEQAVQDDARLALADARAEADAALERSLASIREIEQDHRTGNLSDDDFAALDRAERARAAELVRRRDELAAGADPSADGGAPG